MITREAALNNHKKVWDKACDMFAPTDCWAQAFRWLDKPREEFHKRTGHDMIMDGYHEEVLALIHKEIGQKKSLLH